MSELYIGLMSGTSLDGIDGVLVDFASFPAAPLLVMAHGHRPFEAALAGELLALNRPGANEIHRAALAGNAVARAYAEVVEVVLQRAGVARERVLAIGAHGQTVRHRPLEFDGTGYTVQLINPALLAERCSIDVVADLRSRDLAAGGQGAPLVPAFHRAVFGRADETIAVLNLGGIGNLTTLRADGTTIGFDCGPGNALLDHWCGRHTGRPYDDGGRWAASGQVLEPLLQRLGADPYFTLLPPKSTGRDLFNPDWLDARLAASDRSTAPENIQATLAELTAATAAAAVQAHAADARTLLVCGGGAFNGDLLQRLGRRLPGVEVAPSARRGLPPDQVEACAFAWLARAFVRRECASLPSVTGAAGARVLGAIYPSSR